MIEPLSAAGVAESLARHAPLYRWRKPVYQQTMLLSLARMWDYSCRVVLDIGGGTGLIAQAIHDLFPVDKVTSVDVEDRFAATLTIETAVYDGCRLPSGDGAADCVLLMNVLHHVPPSVRPELLRECRRVAGHGPVYIKDHLPRGILDDARLAVLDMMGNVPFKGMVRAQYLRAADWTALADSTGYRISERASACYRTGLFAGLFPNRLEILMKWVPLQGPAAGLEQRAGAVELAVV